MDSSDALSRSRYRERRLNNRKKLREMKTEWQASQWAHTL